MSKNVIITGAAGGIGIAFVKAFSEAGYNVWACARKPSEKLDRLILELSQNENVWVKPIYFDLLDDDEIKSGISEIIREKHSIDVLCNVAGIGHMQLLGMTRKLEIDQIFKVNVLAPIYITQMILKVMRRQKRGIVLNVTSTAADEEYDGNTIYGATKAALNQFTRSLAFEVANDGIVVNAIAPGLTDTRMSAVFEGNNPELPLERSALKSKALPEEIADVAVHMCCDEMRAVNGQVIKIHGKKK